MTARTERSENGLSKFGSVVVALHVAPSAARRPGLLTSWGRVSPARSACRGWVSFHQGGVSPQPFDVLEDLAVELVVELLHDQAMLHLGSARSAGAPGRR